MPDIDAWAGDTFPLSTWLDDADPAVDNARIVGDKTTSITVLRAGSELSAQTVRLEDLRGERQGRSDSAYTGMFDMLVLGYEGHPSITDTDLQRGDRFAVEGEMFEVVVVTPALGNTFQAYATVRS